MLHWIQKMPSCGQNASLDTNINCFGSTMSSTATMAISLIWLYWRYGHSGYIDIDDAMSLILVSKEA